LLAENGCNIVTEEAVMGTGVEFGELVSLLSKTAPAKLETLRGQFPQNSSELKPGSVLGEGQSTNIGCTVAVAALNEYAPAAADLRGRIRARLAWSLRFDFVAKFAAACGSGGAVGVLATGIAADKAIIASVVALIGSLCGLLFSYLQRDEAAGSVAESYNRLIGALVQAGDLQRSLPMMCAAGDSPELKDALTRANDTARILNELILRFS
jgi:hypothetical protein